MHSGAMPKQARWKNSRVVQDQAVAWLEEVREIAEHPILPALLSPVQHEHAGTRAIGKRLLRDRLLRQVIIEGREVQAASITTWSF